MNGKILRAAGWSLFLAGVLIGTVSDRDRANPPARDGEYWILTGDFHVHAFFGDGALGPWDLRREARRRRLNVIAVTNHNQMVTAHIAAKLPRQEGDPLLIPGDEITAIGYHMIAVGIQQPIDWRLSPALAIEAIHAQGGIAIAAHPGRDYWPAFDDEALTTIDGVEVFHPAMKVFEKARVDLPAFYKRARHIKPGVLAPIGSSDFHFHAPMAEARTYLLAREFSVQGVLDALRSGRTVVYDDLGNSYGNPADIAVVDRHRQPELALRGRWQSVAVACSLLGLFMLVVVARVGVRAAPAR